MKIKIKWYHIIILTGFIIGGCTSCNEEKLVGKYYKETKIGVENYLEIKENGFFLHYFSNNDTILKHEGKWNLNDKGFCQIEFNGWNNFDDKGINFEKLGNQILFIDGSFLNYSPDGNTLSSFKKRGNGTE